MDVSNTSFNVVVSMGLMCLTADSILWLAICGWFLQVYGCQGRIEIICNSFILGKFSLLTNCQILDSKGKRQQEKNFISQIKEHLMLLIS